MNAVIFAQTDSTGQKITLIVFALVAVAAALGLLTAWYWRITDPTRRRQSPNGRDGRRPGAPAPEPSPESPPAVTISAVPSPAAGTRPDHTRVMRREEILEPKLRRSPDAEGPLPEVIDLRTPSAQPPAGDPPVPVTDPEPTVDIDALQQEALTDDAHGAHDDGIDFDEWLALAEEEK